MGAEKLNQGAETMEQQIKDSWKDFGDDEADEETLSLCDLVMKSDSKEFWNDDFSKDQDQQKSNDDGDLFEFFSEDYFPAARASTFPENNNNNIVFCGKIISYKGNQPNVSEKSQSLNSKIKQENDEKKMMNSSSSDSCLFPWKFSSHSFNNSRIFTSSRSTKGSKGKSFNKSLSMPAASGSNSKNNYGKLGGESKRFGDEKFDFSVKKVSVLATPVKSRWYYYLFAFGVGRLPMEIELKDMKMRQSRKSKAMKFQAPGGGGGGAEPENVKGDKERRRSGKGLWRLLKVLRWKQGF